MGIPDVCLGEFGQLLLHVFLQLPWSQNGLADRTDRGLSVIETLHFAWKTKGERESLKKQVKRKSVSQFCHNGGLCVLSTYSESETRLHPHIYTQTGCYSPLLSVC